MVEKATSTRATLSHYIEDLQRHIGAQRQQAAVAAATTDASARDASSSPAPSLAADVGVTSSWVEPVLGIFVLHSKGLQHQQEAAALPLTGLEGLGGDDGEGRYFVCEHVDREVHIAYPFHVEPTNNVSAASVGN